MAFDRRKQMQLSNVIVVIGIALGFVALVGILGGGFCERLLFSSPIEPDPASGQIVAMNLKGGVRFMTATTAMLCKSSIWIAFLAIGGAAALSIVRYFAFKRLPHKK